MSRKSKELREISVDKSITNIVPQKKMYEVIDDVFQDLADTIAHTLGPAGGNTLVTEPYAAAPIYPCKDGYTIMNVRTYNNIVYETIYRIIREISGRMNETVGDGTTSSVIIANAFYKAIRKYLKRHKEITPYGIKTLLDWLLEEINDAYNKYYYVYAIDALPKEQRIEIYRRVATIAANNDNEIGDTIAEAYNRSKSDRPFLDISLSTDSETHINMDIGFEMPYGFYLPFMVNSADGMKAEYDNPVFLLVNGVLGDKSLEHFKQWCSWCAGDNRPFVVIAEGFSKDILDFITLARTGIPQNVNGRQILVKLPLICITFNMSSTYGIGQLQDLEAILGASALQTNNGCLIVTPENPQEFYELLGRADHIESMYAMTRIKGGAGDPEKRNGRRDEVQKLLNLTLATSEEGTLYRQRIAHLRHRIAMLEGEMMTIKVGADSYKERKNKKLIFDDAYLAVKSCAEKGISLGGNVGIYSCCKSYRTTITDAVVNRYSEVKNIKNIGVFMTEQHVRRITEDILDIIAETSLAAFKEVFKNAHLRNKDINEIFYHLKEYNGDEKLNIRYLKPYRTFNVLNGKFENLDAIVKSETAATDDEDFPRLIVPGNTDYEILRSVFGITGMFLTANQMISLIVDKRPSVQQKDAI